MRKFNNWMVLAGIVLIVGGAVSVWLTIRNNLPSPFDVASSSGSGDAFLPVLAPAGAPSVSGSATQVGAPTLSADGSFTPAATPPSQSVGLTPDRLMIPGINLDAPIIPVRYKKITVSGKDYYQWLAPDKFAVGWQDSSALIGVPGNTVLNGHHNAFGKVFKDLVKLNVGDVISIFSGAQELRYQVVAKMLLPERFQPLEVRMANARWIEPSVDERITLITCWPADSNTHRVIVVAFPIDRPVVATQPNQTAQSAQVTICNNDVTLTVNQSDLGQYPGYAEGACPQQDPGLTITKSVAESSYTLAGDRLHYSYRVTNTGTQALTGVSVTDDKTTVSCPKTSLEPAESMTCSAVYIVKNSDINSENIVNTAYTAGHLGDTLVTSPSVTQTVNRYLKIVLSSICAEDPSKNVGWQVVNNNPYPVGYEYAIDGGVAGVGTVASGAAITFVTPAGSGTGVMSLYSGGIRQNNAVAAKGCH